VNLSREGIVAAAMEVLDLYGLGDVSMRRLAADLDVTAPALYNYFGSKQELLAAMAGVILADLPELAPGDLAGGLRVWTAHLYAALYQHRGGAELVWAVLTLKPWDEGPGAAVAAALEEAGWPAAKARFAARKLLHATLAQAFDDDQRRQAKALGLGPGPEAGSLRFLDQMVVETLRA
jgi:AcrR family transcriptional regulator